MFVALAAHTTRSADDTPTSTARAWLDERSLACGSVHQLLAAFAAPTFSLDIAPLSLEHILRAQQLLARALDSYRFFVEHSLVEPFQLLLLSAEQRKALVERNRANATQELTEEMPATFEARGGSSAGSFGDDDISLSFAQPSSSLHAAATAAHQLPAALRDALDCGESGELLPRTGTWLERVAALRARVNELTPTPAERDRFESSVAFTFDALVALLALLWQRHRAEFAAPVQQFVSRRSFWRLLLDALLLRTDLPTASSGADAAALADDGGDVRADGGDNRALRSERALAAKANDGAVAGTLAPSKSTDARHVRCVGAPIGRARRRSPAAPLASACVGCCARRGAAARRATPPKRCARRCARRSASRRATFWRSTCCSRRSTIAPPRRWCAVTRRCTRAAC